MKGANVSLVVNDIIITKVWSDSSEKDFWIVINTFRGNRFCNVGKITILLFVLLKIILKNSWLLSLRHSSIVEY